MSRSRPSARLPRTPSRPRGPASARVDLEALLTRMRELVRERATLERDGASVNELEALRVRLERLKWQLAATVRRTLEPGGQSAA